MSPKLKIILSMFIFGTMAIFVRNINLPAAEIALFRAVIASLVLVFYKVIKRESIPVKAIKKEILILVISGGAMALNWIFLFEAYNRTSVSIATLSYYFAPVIVMTASSVLFKEKLTSRQIFCFIMATAGLVLVVGVKGSTATETSLLGVAFGLSAAVHYAIVILLNKYIKSVSGMNRTLIQFFAAVAILTPYIGFSSGFHIFALNLYGLINLIILGALHTGLIYCLYFSALNSLSGREIAIYSYIDPMVAVIISMTILREPLLPLQITGGVMIFLFTLLSEITPGKKNCPAGDRSRSISESDT